MATRYAVATGNWSDVTTWDGGTTLPMVGDDVYANSYTVLVNQDITVTKISTEVCPTTSIGGGLFQPTQETSYIWICNIFAGTTQCVYNSNATVNLVGNIHGGTSTNAYGSSGRESTWNIIGNVYAGSGSGAVALSVRSTSYAQTINIVGNVYASAQNIAINGSGSPGIQTVVGNVYASNYQAITYGQSCTITGNVYGSSLSAAVIAYVVSSAAYSCRITGSIINIGGLMAVLGAKIYINPDISMNWTFQKPDDTDVILYTADVLENPPATTDVRSGIVYGIANNYTGTLAVPPAESVVKNVPTDDTVGSWAFDATLITRLERCATTGEVDSTVAAYNT